MGKIYLKINTVIFDMDGVITNTMPDHFRAWKTALIPYGVLVNHFDIYCREGQRGINSVEELFNEKNKPYHRQLAEAVLREKERLFKKIAKRRFIPGARRFIKRLHQDGIKLALVTGTSRHELHQILPDYLYDLFDVTITGTDVKRGKPHPEPYLSAIQKLKIKPKQAIVIENAPFGIRSAKAAGLTCLAIATSLPKEYLKGADYIFSDFPDLCAKVHFNLNGHAQK